MVFLSLCAFLLLMPVAAVSQATTAASTGTVPDTAASPADPKAFPLREIEIAGNEVFPTDGIIALTDLTIGEQTTPQDFQRAMNKLRDSGAFESLSFRYGPHKDGYKVTFTLQEVSELYPVRFEGFGVPEEELHALLKEKVALYVRKAPPAGPLATLIGNVLQRFWIEQGKDSKIIGRLAPVAEDDFELVFQPPSAIKTIAFVTFDNTGEVSPLDLQRRFNQAAMGVPFSQPRLRELLHHNARPLYEEKGRLAVKFCPCTAEPDTETQGLLVSVHVEQGPVYTFGETRFAESNSIDPSHFSDAIQFEEGETADMSRVQASLAKIEQTLRANGYMRAFARHDRELDHDAKTVDIVIDIRPGGLYTFNKLKITGLDIVGEAAVKKRWGIMVGDPFNASYPNVFLRQVATMFDNLSKTDSKITVNEEDKTVDVELIFE